MKALWSIKLVRLHQSRILPRETISLSYSLDPLQVYHRFRMTDRHFVVFTGQQKRFDRIGPVSSNSVRLKSFTCQPNYFFMLLILGFALACSGQRRTEGPPAHGSPAAQDAALIDELKRLVKRNSLVAERILWADFRLDLEQIARRHPGGRDSIYRQVLQTLRRHGDAHSSISQRHQTGPLTQSSPRSADGIECKPVEAAIGYIRVPSFLSFDSRRSDSFSLTLQAGIKAIDTAASISGWIVDLRQNTGGTLRPMLAGLNPLVPDGVAGYWIGPSGRPTAWHSNGRNFMGQGRFYKIKHPRAPIAVLIDSMTASSAEIIAISFIGLRNVQTFGQHSAGFTTSNTTFPLPGGDLFHLATAYAADRKKRLYRNGVNPDVVLSQTGESDQTFEAARRWILQHARLVESKAGQQ